MAERRVSVIIQPLKGSEEEFFVKQDRKLLKKLRKKVTKETNKKYRKEHNYHCFRCGTKSLVEVERGNVKIDICVNNNCGAIHLDPGELEKIIKDQRAISIVRNSVLSVFKK